MTYKICFHGGPAGNHRNIGTYYRDLDAAGIPAFIKSVDHYGHCHELLEIAKGSTVPHQAVFRLSTRGQDDGFDYDVPQYGTTPKNAAHIHWQATIAKLPPEFNKDCWIEPINEVDKNRADWLGQFAYEIGLLAIDQGYKVALFGWSGGEPEYDHWKTAGMRKYFDLCAQHPDQLAVSLHEYSFTVDKLMDSEPYYLVGRFRQLIDACAEMGVRCPKIFITEFGWEYRNVPAPSKAMPQLLKAANLYAAYDEVELAAIWYLGGYFGDIHNQTQKLILPVRDQALAFPKDKPEPPEEPPPPDPDTPFLDRLWEMSIDRQLSHGIQLAPTAIQKAIRADGFHPVTDEVYFKDDPPWMAAEDWENRTRPRRVYWWQDGKVMYIEAGSPPPDPGPDPPPPPPSGQVDLLPYFIPVSDGYGPLYEVKDPDGAQRRCQVQVEASTRKFWLTKGTAGLDGRSEFEELAWDKLWIWRGLDTSPGAGRFYVQFEYGGTMARWCPRFMSVGQVWTGAGHYVQFFMKGDCSKSSPNSGPATNQTKFFDRNPVNVNGLNFNDVIHIGRPGGEEFWFARGIGMIGWKSGWNQSWISELHAPGQRPNNIKETVCPYSLG